ncbi:MAG TPA: PLP-dependent aminotransferase family protein [Acidimicrobiales bacterium]|nr:PLP-dependent aminotransferase family protein [Acidimicrobiales bacterium]
MLDVDPAGGRRDGIERALRTAIRSGRLAAGTALPASRALAADLGVARGTVVDAYGQLVAEGYLAARPGGRTVVASLPSVEPSPPPAPRSPPPAVDLRAGAPDLSLFPAARWAAALRAVLRSESVDALDYAPPRGRPELAEALAAYLGRSRGVVARPAQVVVCAGVDHALAVLARALGDRGPLALEDPCLHFHRTIVAGAGASVVPAPVDGDGVVVEALADAGTAVVTPARQAVLGVTLAPARRTALLAWARAGDRVVVEDDYDGELRYDRQPIGALQGLDPERVVYLGTLSKSLAPGLRLAWAVVPDGLAGAVDAVLGTHSPVSSLDQLVVAELLGSQAFDRHLRRLRATYRRRRDEFVDRLAAAAPRVGVDGVAAGLHALVGWPPGITTEAAVMAEAEARGIGVTPLAPGWHGDPRGEGVMVGYGRPPAHDLRRCYGAFAVLMADITR